MPHPNDLLAQLIASRICHDLISPVGAINNGVELFDMAGGSPRPEMGLIRDSASNASGRIRLFRLAFGAAHRDQAVSASEMATLLRTAFPGPLRVIWAQSDTIIRPRAQAACLAILCLERCLPGGGEIVVSGSAEALSISSASPTLRRHDPFWAILDGGPIPEDLPPAEIQFALLPDIARQNGFHITSEHADTSAKISF